jgi:Lrp/AsnC family leucine-responsive transcriptional regulator
LRVSPKIDEIDVKILKTLLVESRTSFAEIARDCSISTNAVRVRYENLKKKGVITGEIMEINPHCLSFGCVGSIEIMTDKDKEAQVVDLLNSKKWAISRYNFFGKHNIVYFVALQNTERFVQEIEELKTCPDIRSLEAAIYVNVANIDHPENLVIRPSKTTNSRGVSKKATCSDLPLKMMRAQGKSSERLFKWGRLDRIDRQIVKILSENSRTPFRKIAPQVGVSTTAVIDRYRKLRGTVFTHSTITVDMRKLGYKATAILFLRASNQTKMLEVQEQLLHIPNVIVAFSRILDSDKFTMIVPLFDFEDLFALKENISKIQSKELVEIAVHEAFPKWPINAFASLIQKLDSFKTASK